MGSSGAEQRVHVCAPSDRIALAGKYHPQSGPLAYCTHDFDGDTHDSVHTYVWTEQNNSTELSCSSYKS